MRIDIASCQFQYSSRTSTGKPTSSNDSQSWPSQISRAASSIVNGKWRVRMQVLPFTGVKAAGPPVASTA